MVKKLTIIILCLLVAAVAAVAVVLGLTSGSSDSGTSTGDASQSGETTSGGNTSQSGGSTSGGNTSQSGGSTSGGNTSQSGGSTSGGNTSQSGGSTSGGNTSQSGGSTSGGNASQEGDTADAPEVHVCSYVFSYTVPADCINGGYDVYECTCGNTENRNLTKALGHDYKDTIHSATCSQDWSMTSVCTRCNDTQTQTVADSKLPHDYVWTETRKATCALDGSKTGVCTVCGATETQAIPAIGHSYGTYVSNNDATCTHDGTKTAICSTCGASDTVKDENAIGAHQFGAWTTVAGTCIKEGSRSRTCSACGYKESYSTGYGNHDISGNACTLCGQTLQTGTGKFYLYPETSTGAGNFDSVYLEFTVLSVDANNYVMTYDMYIVQSYTVDGQRKDTRTKIEVPNPDSKNCGTFTFTVWSVSDNANVKFSGWIDYDVYPTDKYVSFIIGCYGSAGGNSYSINERFYISY